MDRREFLRTAGVTGVAGGIAGAPATAFVPAHNWDKYDFGSGPPIADRLNQGPFPQYPPEEVIPGLLGRHGHDTLEGNRSELRQGAHHLHHCRHGQGGNPVR